MVELAATLFVIIVALNVIAIFVRGVGGWGNAGLRCLSHIGSNGHVPCFPWRPHDRRERKLVDYLTGGGERHLVVD